MVIETLENWFEESIWVQKKKKTLKSLPSPKKMGSKWLRPIPMKMKQFNLKTVSQCISTFDYSVVKKSMWNIPWDME